MWFCIYVDSDCKVLSFISRLTIITDDFWEAGTLISCRNVTFVRVVENNRFDIASDFAFWIFIDITLVLIDAFRCSVSIFRDISVIILSKRFCILLMTFSLCGRYTQKAVCSNCYLISPITGCILENFYTLSQFVSVRYVNEWMNLIQFGFQPKTIIHMLGCNNKGLISQRWWKQMTNFRLLRKVVSPFLFLIRCT